VLDLDAWQIFFCVCLLAPRLQIKSKIQYAHTYLYLVIYFRIRSQARDQALLLLSYHTCGDVQ